MSALQSPGGADAAEAVDTDALLRAHDPLAASFPKGLAGRVLFWLAVVFSAFQIATAAHLIDLPSQIVRAIHVAFLMALAFPLVASAKSEGIFLRTLSWLAAGVAIALAAYQWIEYTALLLRAGDPTQLDMVVGIALLSLLFIVTWRIMGPALPIIAGTFLAYCLFGQYLPAPLNHRGYALSQVIDHMAFGTEGVYGIPT